MPWALAACASIILPFASPKQYKCGTGLPSESSTCIRSSTGTNPLCVTTATFSRPRPLVNGARPVAIRAASTSKTSFVSLVFVSISSI
ncbi:hypothetical protein M758_8G038500 [Ceratodon purpureus]|nr:hypothetical protein M758_8G038200 [Ceratodon purpureus]KAG0607561.1 hypothetical protein M758_8G038500 [Ceratodon purpureus]